MDLLSLEYKNLYGIIYILINKINGKSYIGQTKRKLKKRIHEHCNEKQGLIYKAIRKYGFENFNVQVLAKAENQNQLNELEIFYIEAFNSIKNGYNLTKGGENPPSLKGVKRSDSFKKKLRDSKLGSRNHRFGVPLTEEKKKYLSNLSQKKPIFCIETNEYFNSDYEAAKKYGLHTGNIKQQVEGKRNYVGNKNGQKFTFKYI